MLARLFVFFGGLFVLALCAALVGPYFVDWTSYRADFEREASAVLGRAVTVQGAASARLLPFPSVTFNDVSVAGGPEGQPAMTVETFSMDAELAPFLRGEVLIFDMRLVRPKATINIAADGAVDWTIRPSSPFDAGQIAIEKLTVTEGEVVLRHAAGARAHILSGINATVSAKSLAGPWRMDGSLEVDGMRTRLSASTGRVGEGGHMRVRLKADPDAYPLVIETDGNARVEKGALLYSGDFKVSGAGSDTASLRAADGKTVKVRADKPTPAAELGYRLKGKFQLNHRKLDIDEFRFETGPLDNPYAADGKASVDLGPDPRFSIEADGAQVQFDEAVSGEAAGGLTLAQRIAALKTALLALPRPAMPGTVEVKLPAVVTGDTTIRDVHLSAEPTQEGWAVKSFGATLPGRTTLEADGMLAVGKDVGFTGSLLLAVAQPSGFAAWLAKDVDEAIRRLPAAGFKAEVAMTGTRQTFSDLELVLGKASFRGRIDASEPGDARPSVDLRLEGGELDVDGLAAFASLFVSDRGTNRFSGLDLDFQIKAGPVDAGGLKADTVDTALRLREGLLEIDKLSVGGLAGAEISATGRIKDFPESPTGDLDASVVALDLGPLIDMAAGRYPDNVLLQGLVARARANPDLFQNARIDIVASAADDNGRKDGGKGLAVSAQGKAGGTAFSASISAQGDPDEPADAALSVTFDASNADATPLLALYGLPVLQLGVVGEATSDLSAKGTLGGGLATTFNFSGRDFKALFEGTVKNAGQGMTAKGRVGLDAADIEPWLMTTGVALPGMGLGTSVTLAANADYGDGLLALDNLDGAVNEAAVSGNVDADIEDGRPHLTGSLALDEVDFDPAAVMLFGAPAFLSDGQQWPTTPFAENSTAPFSAEFDLNAGALSAGRFATAYNATFSARIDREGLRVSNLKARLFGGDLAGFFELRNNGGTGLLSGQMTLAGADLAKALPDFGLTGTGNFSTVVSTSGKSVDAMIGALAGSGTAAFRGLTIAGVNPDAFASLIARADAIGHDIDAAKTAAFAPQVAAAGSFVAQDTELAFTLAAGVLRAPPVTLENPKASLTSNLSADLGADMISASGTIAYQPGDEALVGSEPVIGFSVEGPFGATERRFDSGPLSQFLTQRALEKEQRRVEAMQADLLEKQRLRREARYYAALQDERERAAEELRAQQEEARARAEAEAKAQAAAKAQAEAERRAEEAIRIAAQEKARLEAERRAAEQQQAPRVERAPLPPVNEPNGDALPADPAPTPKLEPFTLEKFLKSLR